MPYYAYFKNHITAMNQLTLDSTYACYAYHAYWCAVCVGTCSGIPAIMHVLYVLEGWELHSFLQMRNNHQYFCLSITDDNRAAVIPITRR